MAVCIHKIASFTYFAKLFTKQSIINYRQSIIITICKLVNKLSNNRVPNRVHILKYSHLKRKETIFLRKSNSIKHQLIT